MIKKIIFVNPPIPGFGSYEGVLGRLPPLGILLLASIARKEGLDVGVLDAYNQRMPVFEALGRVLSFDPDFVCLTSNTEHIAYAAAFAERLKSQRKRFTVIIGGPHVTAAPKDTLERFSCFDYGFIGESDDSLFEFIKKGTKSVPGLVFRRGNSVIVNLSSERIGELDRLPFPSFDLLEGFPEEYQPTPINFKRFPSCALVLSRGCPWDCYFCDRSVFGGKHVFNSPLFCVSLITYLCSVYKVKDICFYDDIFTIPDDKIRKICELMMSGSVDVSWSCLSRADCVNEKTLQLMKKAGCWQISYGLESGSDKVLAILNKKIRISAVRQAIGWTRDAGISVRGFFMIGCPEETEEDIEKTWKLIKDAKLDNLELEFFTPIPGSVFVKNAAKYGSFDPDWSNVCMHKANFVPNTMTRQKLEKNFKRITRKFYMQPRVMLSYTKKLFSGQGIFILKGFFAFLRIQFSKSE